ncbi:FecCD family ABC transporter permease [Paenibacillus taiwanensis]|uniref:FecCD family ABC transporter permease n=1 Tax=Paenibacillus taiwanensis TaxID=401638 RepID=UPI0003F55B7B|nr:iron ABC transporter permease [Paenibacillus taiwanensis]
MPSLLSRSRFWLVLGTGMALTLIMIYVSLTNGEFDMTVTDVINTLLRHHPVPEHDLVIFEFRLPRIVIAALVGIGLAVAGTVIQGISRNGLADPGLLGINAGAGAAIVIFMLLFGGTLKEAGFVSVMAMPMFGWVGGVFSALIIYALSWRHGQLDPQRLLLVGIAVGSAFGAITLFVSLKMNPNDFEMATVWLTGSIWNANWMYILTVLPWLILLLPVIMVKSRELDMFMLGDAPSKSLGVRLERDRFMLLLCSVGLVSACVAVSGSIGFVGLIAPHIAKRLVGVEHARVLPVAGVIGMLLVVGSDFIGKTVFSPAELPVGIVISIVGVPYFVYLLLRSKK